MSALYEVLLSRKLLSIIFEAIERIVSAQRQPQGVGLSGKVCQRTGTCLVALFCFLIALAMPLMEVVPFSANGAGLALMMFGLSLMANDGLWALLALILTGGTVGGVAYALL
ncbi:exopolysaccharide biosynthesis protein [Chromohalobacter sp. HP20-39]|uniref:exopolysaccharide biosynthesis protein n=1 Tax=Chromohalobacter sp. HP20-39 TaxID=3079306 RepID=UPI00294AFD8C|nr:exopolysaccharide biosynthesis protein [Chromohalobacter sp. HP20-39]MDV6317708.1 exopolysaccharide biosynthesis protein [Chromohalobacter sp. HP20-39]